MAKNQPIDLADLSLITPGAVFHRKNGKKRFVLFLTNTSVPVQDSDKYPPRVVFANEENQVFCVSAENFIKNCKFYNVEPVLEERLNNLLAFIEPEANEDEDLAFTLGDDSGFPSLEADEQPAEASAEDEGASVAEDETAAVETAASALVENDPQYLITFAATGNPSGIGIPAELLSEMVVAYDQEPNLGQGAHFHKITFQLPANIS